MCLARTPSPFDMFYKPVSQGSSDFSLALCCYFSRIWGSYHVNFVNQEVIFSSKGSNNPLGLSSQHLVINTAALLCFSCPDHFLFWMAASPKPVAPGKVGLGPWRRVEGRLCSVLARIQLLLSQWLNSAHLSLSHSCYLQALQFCMNCKVCGPESLFQHLGKT